MGVVQWKRMKRIVAVLVMVGMLQMTTTTALAVNETTGSEMKVTTYATVEQLMNVFSQNGSNSTIGKVVFGRDSNNAPLEWYILGNDTGVGDGKNIIIFAANPIMTGQTFLQNKGSNKAFDTRYGKYENNPKEVYPNHYGASDLRALLRGLAVDGNYFTDAEQSIMQATTISTYDSMNKTNYTTQDVLYALESEYNDLNLFAGSGNDKILPMSIYWNSGERVWLRTPNANTFDTALLADPGYFVRSVNVDLEGCIRPATNIDLSSVLFASAATSALSENAEIKTISEGKAMSLRLDGRNSNIGSVAYYAENGNIEIAKGTTTGVVSLVIQGNDGVSEWYYSKRIGQDTILNLKDIEKELLAAGINELNISSCEMWVETTIDNVTYAVNMVEKTVPVPTPEEDVVEDMIKKSDDGQGVYRIPAFGIGNHTATYVKPSNKKKSKVKIPATVRIDGVSYKVVAIEKDAFKNNKYIKSVTIGKNIKTIGSKAFYKCKKLTTVTVGKNVSKIGAKAFYGCSKLKTITIQSTKLKTKNIGSNAFSKTPKYVTVKVPKKKCGTYKKMLTKRGVNKKAKFKKY